MKRLGGDVVGINEVANSSMAKGESLLDSIKVLAEYSDAIVLRYSEKGVPWDETSIPKVPIFNAGDGCGEHPTQALLDLFTIAEHFPHILNKSSQQVVVSISGDLKHGRTVHSLVMLLARYNVVLNFVAPASFELPKDLEAQLESIFERNGWSACGRLNRYTSLDEIICSTDILYMTRIQTERLNDLDVSQEVFGVVTPDLLFRASPTLRIMHPLPRLCEIPIEVDLDNRAIYFQQAANGVYVRMSLLWLVLSP